MTDLFVSYKRENETRVARIVNALSDAGYSVWWDRGLAGGESWRDQIQEALDAAKCVVVIWTHESVGPEGDFVRDEAGQAKRRDVLVPVLLDAVAPPLGFGEIQAVDLTRWNGKASDPFFKDLCAAVAAKLEGRPVPPAKGPMKRVMRRLTYGGIGAFVVSALAIGFNLFSAQDQLCGLPLAQPQLSDACGALGLGNRATGAERVSWEERERGSCAALRTHVEQFPDGAYRSVAAELLQTRRVTQAEDWVPGTRRLTMYQPQSDAPSSDEAKARSAVVSSAQRDAERLCKGFAATTSFKFVSATPEPQVWHCSAVGTGTACGFEGEALCELLERYPREDEHCAH